MLIYTIGIKHLRNIVHAEFQPGLINVLYGENGSGKSSILEALHLLFTARSFRTNRFKYYLHQQTHPCLITAIIGSSHSEERAHLGFLREVDGLSRIRYQSRDIKTAAELARLIPVQFLSQDSYELITGGPGIRRGLIDWGGFHETPQFFELWQRCRRIIKQRNSLLKTGKMGSCESGVWDLELVKVTQSLTQLRKDYVDRMVPELEQVIAELIDIPGLEVSFFPGWDGRKSYSDVLSEAFIKDKELGFTQHGPHRADLKLKVGKVGAEQALSRGQQKLLVCALKIAQGQMMERLTGQTLLYLIDDLPAELDTNHREKLCSMLERMNCQLFVTTTEMNTFQGIWKNSSNVKMFHVEQGRVNASSVT